MVLVLGGGVFENIVMLRIDIYFRCVCLLLNNIIFFLKIV